MTSDPEFRWVALHGGRGSVVHLLADGAAVAACGTTSARWAEPKGEKPRCRRCYADELEADNARLRAAVRAVRDWADRMEAESPMPGPGGFIAAKVRVILNRSLS